MIVDAEEEEKEEEEQEEEKAEIQALFSRITKGP